MTPSDFRPQVPTTSLCKKYPVSQIQHIAALWSALHYPSQEFEWSVEQKVRAAKEAGFDGVAVYAGLGCLVEKHRLLRKLCRCPNFGEALRLSETPRGLRYLGSPSI